MKSPSSSRPVCKLVRLLGSGRNHVASCADCQDYFRQASDLSHSLRREAACAAPAPSGSLDDSIIRAIRQEQPVAAVSRRSSEPRTWLSIGGAVAAGVVLALFVVKRPTAFPEHDLPVDVTEIVTTAQSLSRELWDSVQPSATALVQNNLLQDEINSVYNDAQSAVSFLEANFLPAGIDLRREPSLPPGRQS
jgi:hypothetical protein